MVVCAQIALEASAPALHEALQRLISDLGFPWLSWALLSSIGLLLGWALSPGLSWALLGSSLGLSSALLELSLVGLPLAAGLSWAALLGSPELFWALLRSSVLSWLSWASPGSPGSSGLSLGSSEFNFFPDSRGEESLRKGAWMLQRVSIFAPLFPRC